MIIIDKIIKFSNWFSFKKLMIFLIIQLIIVYGLIRIVIMYNRIELLYFIEVLSIISTITLIVLLFELIRHNQSRMSFLFMSIILILLSVIYLMINDKSIYIIDLDNEQEKSLIFKEYHPSQQEIDDKEFMKNFMRII